MIEAVVGKLSHSACNDAIRARGEQPGRPATDPAVLITLLIYVATENIGCGREIERLERALVELGDMEAGRVNA